MAQLSDVKAAEVKGLRDVDGLRVFVSAEQCQGREQWHKSVEWRGGSNG